MSKTTSMHHTLMTLSPIALALGMLFPSPAIR